MIEVVKYLCEFFFCNFWHFCGLLIVLAVAGCGKTVIDNSVNYNKQKRKQNEQ